MALFAADGGGGNPPLIDKTLSAALRRRMTELWGLGFLAFAAVMAAILASYHPEDPSGFTSTNLAPRNWLGYPGAIVADPLMKVFGLAAWGFPAFFAAWGARFLLHRGEPRIWARLAVMPIAIMIGAVFASSHAVTEDWTMPAGLGGILGDTGARAFLDLLPMGEAAGIMVVSVLFGAATLFTAGLALGLDREETSTLAGWLWRSTLRALRTLVRVLRIALARLAVLSAAGVAFVRRKLEKPRSEKLGPAQPTGAWRREPRVAAETEEEAPREDAALTRAIRALKGIPDEPEPIDYDEEEPHRVEVTLPKKPARKSRRAEREEQPQLALGDDGEEAYLAPPLALLEKPRDTGGQNLSAHALEENARMLETVLEDYGIRGEIVAVKPGPVVTLYELEPAPGLKASRVIGLADDIARSMSALSARVSTVPGRSVIGIELPNSTREKVLLREIFTTPQYGDSASRLALALGKDIAGEPVVTNLAKMPHLLIAGTTGSGKSVAVNTMILSLLYRLSPKECRLIMIDPKMLELSVYDGIPHLLAPVVTDPKKAIVALKWVVAEMEDRYRKMSKMGVRNIDGYNARVRQAIADGEDFSRTVQTGFDEDTGEPVYETEHFAPEELPYIVVIVDEMADLMMVAGKEIEACIQRLAQMARASGIHLIMATQRPSVDVITGTIKANFPTRISFQVTSKIDSRTILGEQGAEQLLGMGDMLYMAGGGRITRVHGPFVSDEEVEEVVAHLKTIGAPDYVDDVTSGPDEETQTLVDEKLGLAQAGDGDDILYDKAVAIVARDRKCSTSYIQRKLAIGYNKAARLVEMMEDQGVVSPANAVGKREILVAER